MTEQPAVQPHVGAGPVVPGAEALIPVGNPRRARLWQRTAGAVAVVAVLVVSNATVAGASAHPAGAGAALPSTGSTDGAPPTSAALHGEFRVVNRDGSAQLRRWQSGAVNAIDSISLTVRSADGYDSTYLLGPGVSVTGIGVGDEVTVVGAGQAVSTNDQAVSTNDHAASTNDQAGSTND